LFEKAWHKTLVELATDFRVCGLLTYIIIKFSGYYILMTLGLIKEKNLVFRLTQENSMEFLI